MQLVEGDEGWHDVVLVPHVAKVGISTILAVAVEQGEALAGLVRYQVGPKGTTNFAEFWTDDLIEGTKAAVLGALVTFRLSLENIREDVNRAVQVCMALSSHRPWARLYM